MGAARGVFAITMLLYLLVTLFPPLLFLLVGFIVLRPFSESTYVSLACYIQGSWLCNLVFLMENVIGLQLSVTGILPPREPALVLANHLTHDWAPMYSMAFRMGTLAHVRTVIKKVVSYIPGFGWGMQLCYWPFVSRDFVKDESVLGKLFNAYKASNLPVQLWLYPEGTRMTKAKLAESQEYAKSKGYPVWSHVMLPRHRGFITAINALSGVIRVVHEVTLQYEGWGRPPSFWQIVTSDPGSPHVMHVNVARVPVDEIPADDAGRQKWLMASFARKDALLEQFAKDKKFPGKNLVRKYPLSEILPHVVAWFAITVASFWAVL